MTERRYKEDEVRKIFELATSRAPLEPATPTTADGLTLADIQSIGREVGLQPHQIASAAATMDAQIADPQRTSLGLPVEVGRIVPLPRELTDREWERLITELRTTFKAKGRIAEHGGLREWSNGNLHACVEPTENGYRLRLGSFKGDAPSINALGFAGLAAGAVAFASFLISGGQPEGALAPFLLGAAGIGAFASNWLRVPRWAQRRKLQMDYIAARVQSMVEANVDEKT